VYLCILAVASAEEKGGDMEDRSECVRKREMRELLRNNDEEDTVFRGRMI